MSNNSSTGGTLAPNSTPAVLEDAALLDFFHDWLCALTGLTNDLVRPRWQPEPPNLPLDGVTWLAFGITKRETDTYAAEVHTSFPTQGDTIYRHEVLHFSVSCYGSAADSTLHQLRDGMQVAQNREVLSLNSMGLVESGETTAVPELVKEKWLYRVDMPFSIRRQIVRTYNVLDLASASATLNNEHRILTINN